MSDVALADGRPRLAPGRPLRARPRAPAGTAWRALGPASVIAGSASLQGAAALATTLFATVGVAGTSALRFSAGAVVLLAIARPAVRGRSRRAWIEVVAFGATMAAASFCLFEAVSRLSLGTAVTLQFIGPLGLALLAARRRLDVGCAVAAGGGVVLLTGVPSGASVVGVVFGLLAAACVAASIVAGERVGRRTDGLDGLALAVPSPRPSPSPPASPPCSAGSTRRRSPPLRRRARSGSRSRTRSSSTRCATWAPGPTACC